MTNSNSAVGGSALYKIPFLVGVVGHRDLVADEMPIIRAEVETLLRKLQGEQADVQIKLLSAMADGADILVADVAHALGIEVVALLPFSAAQCREELTSDTTRVTFDRIMQRAERLELPAPEGASASDLKEHGALRDDQFQRAGAIIASYCSLLIAIWDGQSTDHRAGTARVVDYRRRGMTPSDDQALAVRELLLSAEDNDLIYEIRCSRRLSGNGGPTTGPVQVIGFISGAENKGDVGAGLPKGLVTLLERTAGFNRDVAEYATEIARRGRRLAPASPYASADSLLYIDQLFTAADWLGGYFRRCFTRALRARYVLWAILAFLLLGFKKEHEGLLGFVSIGGVLIMFGLGWLLALWAHRRSWSRRYLDYRALAEGLRVDFYWELAGVRAQFAGEFAHESFLQKQDVELEWIRAAMRSVNLRCAMSPRVSWPNGFGHTFAAWVGDADPINGSGQLQYYRLRSKSLERRQEHAEKIARAMLFGGLAVGVALALDAALRLIGRPILADNPRGLMLWALALLTVYGAIFEIYLGEKADRALIRQYRYMDTLFSFAARELRSVRSTEEKLDILKSLGHACLAEHAQWILAHRDKRIEGMRW